MNVPQTMEVAALCNCALILLAVDTVENAYKDIVIVYTVENVHKDTHTQTQLNVNRKKTMEEI
jgi:hypothetical protein